MDKARTLGAKTSGSVKQRIDKAALRYERRRSKAESGSHVALMVPPADGTVFPPLKVFAGVRAGRVTKSPHEG